MMRLLLLATATFLSIAPFANHGARAQSVNVSTQGDGAQSDGAQNAAEDDGADLKPGSIAVRVNGRFRFMLAEVYDQTFRTPGEKQSSTRIGDYARLYPGFDGIAANGLKYGTSLEIRQDTPVAPGGGAASIGGQNRLRGNLYFWREWGYLGAPGFGTVRVGTDDGVSSLYATGTFENFDGGGWNSSELPNLFSANSRYTWPFPTGSSYYDTDKVTYLSPQFLGFDGGVSLEPNTGGDSLTNGNCNTAGTTAATATAAATGCDATSSTTLASEGARRRNTVDALLRYRGTFGPVGIAATGSYIGGGHVTYDGGAVSSTTARYNEGLSIAEFGAVGTFAGFQLGGNVMSGRFNGQGTPEPEGGHDAEAYLIGASYTAGPLIVGASWSDYQSTGDYGAFVKSHSLRREHGIAAGATYTLAPGVSLYISYLWSQRYQGGYNFVGGSNSVAPGVNNKVHAQALALGTGFSW